MNNIAPVVAVKSPLSTTIGQLECTLRLLTRSVRKAPRLAEKLQTPEAWAAVESRCSLLDRFVEITNRYRQGVAGKAPESPEQVPTAEDTPAPVAEDTPIPEPAPAAEPAPEPELTSTDAMPEQAPVEKVKLRRHPYPSDLAADATIEGAVLVAPGSSTPVAPPYRHARSCPCKGCRDYRGLQMVYYPNHVHPDYL